MTAKFWAIVRREYLQRVRTKGFVIATILVPSLMAVLIVIPRLAARSGGKMLKVAVLDRVGTLGPAVEEGLRAARFDGKPRFDVQPADGAPPDAPDAVLREAVFQEKLDGYLVIPEDALAANTASYYGRNVSNLIDLRTMERTVREVVVAFRLTGAGLDPAMVKDLTRELDLKTIRLSAGGEREDRGDALILSVILMTILYTTILMWGQIVMTSVIEEKNSRVVEVLASSVPSTQLLWGKLLGVGAAGGTQFLVWAVSLLVLSLQGLAVGDFKMPEISPLVLASFVLFFLLGFFFFAAIYASIGAAVNTVEEAQNLVFPVILPLIGGMVCFPAVLESPDGGLAVGLSMVPFLAPLIMFLRIVVLTPPMWQIALSLVLLALAIYGAMWAAARIYRVGILMYGKRATLPELLRWVWHV